MSNWYSVKSLYRMEVTAQGAAEPRLSSFEARVVLIRAKTFEDAINKAEDEARRYAEDGNWPNRLGEQVSTRFLGAVDAYALSDELEDGAEVHSSILFLDPSVSDEQIVDRVLGQVSEQGSPEQASFEPDVDRLS